MKAIVFYRHGGPDVLEAAELPTPQPGPFDVLVDIHASALNRLDLFVREGWPGLKLPLPHIGGADAAGVIAAVGDEVTGLQVGQRVTINPTLSCGVCEFCLRGEDQMCIQHALLGEGASGTYAEQIVVPARNVLPLPDDVSYAEAAAANLVMVTAWHSLVRKGNVRPGERVLVVGAGGGVNSASIQIARLAGATVYAVASNAAKAVKARELGADVVVNRAEKPDWSREVFALTERRGVDIVVDNVGAATWMSSIRSLARGGRMLVVGSTSGPKLEIDIRYMFAKHISIIGSTMGSRQDFRDVMELVFKHRLRMPVEHVLPLSEARAAQRMLEQGDVFGKIVLKP
jgi:NADPH:quinone reductase-like Zn-dependent oxidoreductase